ncbi:MAG: fibronectin type III domain-containing protein [Candidatus Thermoplasmatota archaeon]|jgi:hypothetical protein|nr:fibronectin type III domain-containing protein [Candidatus Thermoplasmatota archaeon]
MRKKITILLLFLLLIAERTNGDVEPNDTSEVAEHIVPGTYRSTVNSTDLYDCYSFDVEPGDLITLRFFKSRVVFEVNNNLGEIAEVDTDDSREISIQTSSGTNCTGYGLRVKYIEDPGDYDFDLILSTQNDTGSGKDAADKPENAWVIGPGNHTGLVDTSNGGSIGFDRTDCYKFKMDGSDMVKITYNAYGYDDIPMIIKGQDGNTVLTFDSTAINEGSIFLPVECMEQWFTIIISAEEPTRTSYNFTIAISRQNDGDSGQDAPSIGSLDIEEGPIKGTLGGRDDVDRYKGLLPAGYTATIRFHTSVCWGSPHVEITYRDEKNAGTIDDSGYVELPSSIDSGDIDLCINVSCMGYTQYVVTYYTFPQNDGGTESDVRSGFDTEISITKATSGHLGGLDSSDAYKVPVGPGTMVSVWIDGANASFYYEADGEPYNVSWYGLDMSTFCFSDLKDYHDAFVIVGPGNGDYDLMLYSEEQDDSNSGGDAYSGTDPELATLIETGEWTGNLDEGWDNVDMYSIELHRGENIVLWYDVSTIDLTLRNSTGSIQPWDLVLMDTHSWKADCDGMVTFSFSPRNGSQEYRFGVYIEGIPYDSLPTAPVLNIKVGDGNLTLTWNEPSSDGGSPILGYTIYRWTSDDVFYILNTTDSSTFAYVDMSGFEGVMYFYCISAFNANGVGPVTNNVSGKFQSSDWDRDGIPNEWEERYSLDPNNPNDASMDFDKDGKTNIEEFHDGTNPIIPEDVNSSAFWNFLVLFFVGVVLQTIVIVVILSILILRRGSGSSEIKRKDRTIISEPIEPVRLLNLSLAEMSNSTTDISEQLQVPSFQEE